MFRLKVKDGAMPFPRSFLSKLGLFTAHSELLSGKEYVIKSDVRMDVLEFFADRVDGGSGEVTKDNARELRALSDELGFSGLDDEIRKVLGEEDGAAPGKVGGMTTRELPYDETKPLDGIITYLTQECGGNVCRKGVVEITVSSGTMPEALVKIGSHSPYAMGPDFCSDNEPDSWICYDFKEMRVTPTSYSIGPSGWGACPVSWVLEASNDRDGVWTVIDRRENIDELRRSQDKGGDKGCNFTISGTDGSFRFIRLRQTGKNDRKRDSLIIGWLEIFGTLVGPARPVASSGEFVFDYVKPLDGIIAHLTRECGGNVHTQGIVLVTASDGTKPDDVVILGSGSDFSAWGENSWICYDFQGMRVTPRSYSIQTSWRGSYPKSWAFEVSNDGNDWLAVDRRDDNNELNSKGAIRNFTISDITGSFRFIRFRLTGPNHSDNYELRIRSLEVFGNLIMPSPPVAGPGEFVFNFLKPLDGIIAHLTRECGGNVHKNGVVEVTASSGSQPEDVVDLGSDSEFTTNKQMDAWICYDFKGMRVTPTSYTIQSCRFKPHLKEWELQASNDGEHWQTIDGHRSWKEKLIGSRMTRNFAVTGDAGGSFRFIRLRQTRANEAGDYALRIGSLEVFGTLSGK